MHVENLRVRGAATVAALLASLTLTACAVRAGAEVAASSEGTSAPTSSA